MFSSCNLRFRAAFYTWGFKEMSSILADQQRPRIWAQMRGKGGELRGLCQWVQLYTGAQINFGDLTPYLTCGSTDPHKTRSAFSWLYWFPSLRLPAGGGGGGVSHLLPTWHVPWSGKQLYPAPSSIIRPMRRQRSTLLQTRCLFDPWIRDPGWAKNQDPDYFLELGNHFFGLKYLNSLMRIRDPGWTQFGSGIRDKHPGSATLLWTYERKGDPSTIPMHSLAA